MMDYHTHSRFCGHAEGGLEEFVLAAIDRGLDEIGFSAHLPKVVDPDPYHAMLEDRLPEYVALAGRLREKYAGRIVIRLGIEADYFPGYEDRTRKLLESQPFDYVYGALHFLGDWCFTSRAGLPRYAEEDPEDIFPRYFEMLQRMISTGLFDILAHPDAIRRADFFPDSPLDEYYEKVARLLAENAMAVELNTGGIRRGLGSPYPQPPFLAACVREGVPVTLGSDAHRPEDVARDFDAAFEILRSAGVSSLAAWEGRRMIMKPISAGPDRP